MKRLRVGELYNIVSCSVVSAYDITGRHTPIGEGK